MDLRRRVADLMPVARDELAELVAMRSVADPRQFPAEECERTARWVQEKFAGVGFTDAHLEKTADGSMAVVGSRKGSSGAAPTVLLYAHYDVQPPLDDDAWRTPPFELTEVDGRWYGRGSADCKGNIVMHLAALRALGDGIPVNLKLVVEGSEEQGTGGLEAFVVENPDLLRADTILVCDTGNAAVGQPAATVSLRGMVNVVVTVEASTSEDHSGMFGGAAPDALWARPAVTILGIDCPPVVGSTAAIVPKAAARLNLRIPPGTVPEVAETALVEHLRAAAPWGVHVTVEVEATGSPFEAATDGPAYKAMAAAMQEAFGRPMTSLGQGGSIPLCNVFDETYPDAEIILIGVEEPQALIHAPNESVHPSEIAGMALTEALFLQQYAATSR